MRNHLRLSVSALLLSCVSLLPPRPAVAQEASVSIIGGTFLPSVAGAQIGYIDAGGFTCTGTLVGTREILTAAHCVEGGPGASGYRVFVAGRWRSVSSVSYNPSFDSSLGVEANFPYDLGMLILSEPVTELAPIPVLRGYRIGRGTKILIAGYGANEKSGSPSRHFLKDFKVGLARVTQANGSNLVATHRPLGASTCAGDSGGPAIVPSSRKVVAVVGTLSAGVNGLRNGRCVLRGTGEFTEVDLQSAASRQFLSGFPGVRYARRRLGRGAPGARRGT